MHTHSILQRERQRLTSIGSSKDPALFQAMRTHVRDDRTRNRSIIVNFADDLTRFGCRFKCKFCSWRDRATELGDIAPTKTAVERFLDGFQGYKVTISGGGDPLFKLGQNWMRLYELINWIHDLGFLVEIVTKETAIARILLDGDLTSAHPGMTETVHQIDQFSLSYEEATIRALSEVSAISKHRLVRVSKVCSPGFSERTDLQVYCDAMLEAGAYEVLLREDFYDPSVTAADAKSIAAAVAAHPGAVRWLPNATCSDNFFLINDTTFMGDAALGETTHDTTI